MKKSIFSFVFIFTIFFPCLVIAQDGGMSVHNYRTSIQKNKTDYYEKQARAVFNLIPKSLDSKNQGVVECTIYNAITVKKYYPSADYKQIVDKLNEVAVKNADPSIRIKAFLASIYISANDLIKIKPDFNSYDQGYIYKQITEQLNIEALAQR